jgi:predicted nucleic acid-binding protein
MICLDTNYLISGLVAGSSEAGELSAWYQQGEQLIAPMPAWFEFVCGPVTEGQEATARAFLTSIVPFGEKEACEAARLFNAIGRNRKYSVDAMIAATAIVAKASLATNNRKDFLPFVPHGLILQ